MAYLNQISADNRRSAQSKSFMLNPKVLIGLGIAAVVALIIIVIGSLSGSGNKERDLVYRINLRSSNLIETISNYNEYIKSSRLKTMGSSLSAVLSNTVSDTNNIIAEEYKDNKAPDKLVKEETDYITDVNNTLEESRLNGHLDRSFVRQFTLEIALLMSLESECIARTKSEGIGTVLSSSYVNLESLHEEFENYTDATN